ncbi:fasciclin domain-containing protein [Sphingomicrobium marinum]|uniref:fasciclin domain-containing protein n=1 Tax=Sphingomicrobium marinum TaxID=1227950 RepID=UPI00223ED4AD|nr:fasciclin domain-containing protein [Sphingomicrobium marinum]
MFTFKTATAAIALGAMASTPAFADPETAGQMGPVPGQEEVVEPETVEDAIEDVQDAREDFAERDNKGEGTIVEIAFASDDFSTLERALGEGEMIEELAEDGPFTIFAPTDAAFAKLPDGTLETLFANDDEEDLIEILKYHVIEGALTAADIASIVAQGGGSASFETMNDQSITIADHGGTLMIMDASGNHVGVISADIMASNGVIHGIDTVLMPTVQ